MRQEGAAAALVTVIRAQGSTPRKAGSKMIVLADGSIRGTVGGGRFEQMIIEAALEALAQGEPRTVKFHLTQELGMCCGGEMEVFVEPLERYPRLYVFGAGHVGAALCAAASRVGFQVTIIDEREEYATHERCPAAVRFVRSYAPSDLRDLGYDDVTYCAVVTHDHRTDQDLCEFLLPLGARFVGMIGSRRKVEMTRQRLEAKGMDPAIVARLHAPIGVEIRAETPEEIAVSIVGELIRERRAGAADPHAR